MGFNIVFSQFPLKELWETTRTDELGKKIMVNYYGSHTNITSIQDLPRNKLCLYCFSNGTINFAYRLKHICYESIDLKGKSIYFKLIFCE